MKKYFVTYLLKDGTCGSINHERAYPICNLQDVTTMERFIALRLTREGKIKPNQLPLTITHWQKFEQPE